MAGITSEIAAARLTEYLAAESAALGNQSYTINGRSLTRANLKEIREGIQFWQAQVDRLAAGGGGVGLQLGVPTDG